MNRQISNTLRKAYYELDSSTAFSSANNLIRKFKGKIAPSVIKSWLKGQEIYALHKPKVNRFRRLKTFSFDEGFFHSDLSPNRVDLVKHNLNCKYLLVITDSFSRKMDCELIKNKSGAEMINGYKKLLKRNKIKILFCDNGQENKNSLLTAFLQKNNIKQFFSNNPTTKSYLAELSIRILRTKIYKFLAFKKTKTFYNVLPKIINSINNTFQPKLGAAPNDIRDKKSKRNLFERLYGEYLKMPREQPTFFVGQKVRALIPEHGKFDKGYGRENYTREIFIINSVIPKKIAQYTIKDQQGKIIRGNYYARELLSLE